MSTEDAKAYLSKREVPRLFECLMTGLMFHRPEDHIQYLIDSLEKVKVKGQKDLTWNMFVEVRATKTPLPPITPDNGKRPTSRGRITPKEDARALTPTKTTPLPPIGSTGLPNVPVIFIMGGPGSGKSVQAEKLAEKHPGWINIHLGELLRAEIKTKDAEDKWKAVKELVVSGELAPEEVTLDLLLNCFKSNTEANGFIIQGFPRDMEQAKAFEKVISSVDAVFLLDCEEDKLTNNVLNRGQKTGRLDDSASALARRMATFKEKTLPVLKYYDDGGKLYIVDGDQDIKTMHDELSIIFETLLQNMENGRIPSPPVEGRPSTGRRSRRSATPTATASAPPLSPAVPAEPDVTLQLPSVTFVPPPEIKVQDEGRKPDLPTAPVIFLAGGPGSGKGTQCQKISARYPDIIHLSMGDILRKEITDKGSADEKWGMITKLLKNGDMAPFDVTDELLVKAMKEHPDARAYLVEGYPRDALQYEDFNRNIGGHSFTILLDCEDQYLHDRLVLRGGGGNDRIDDNIPAIEKKLAFFARTTLPLLKAIDDENKLIVIDGDRDEEEIFYDVVKCLDFSLYGVELQQGQASEVGDKTDEAADEDHKKPVVEEVMVAATASTTGGDLGNPEHTAQLDAAEPTADEQAEAMDELDAGQEVKIKGHNEFFEEEEVEPIRAVSEEAGQEAKQTEQSTSQEEESEPQEVTEANEQAEQAEATEQSNEMISQNDEEQSINEKTEDEILEANQNLEEIEAVTPAETGEETETQKEAVQEEAVQEEAEQQEAAQQEADENEAIEVVANENAAAEQSESREVDEDAQQKEGEGDAAEKPAESETVADGEKVAGEGQKEEGEQKTAEEGQKQEGDKEEEQKDEATNEQEKAVEGEGDGGQQKTEEGEGQKEEGEGQKEEGAKEKEGGDEEKVETQQAAEAGDSEQTVKNDADPSG